jgi:O-antigen ligase
MSFLQTFTLLLLVFLVTIIFLLGGNGHILGILTCAVLLFGVFLFLLFDKPEIGVLAVLFSCAFTLMYKPEMYISFYLVYAVVPLLCFFCTIRSKNKTWLFWFLVFWFLSYYAILLIARPYKNSIYSWIILMLFLTSIFLWSSLVKWDRKKILFIICSYGGYLIAWGFFEKLLYNPTRISGPTGFATNYAILLAVLWTIGFVDFCVQKKRKLWLMLIITFCVFCAILISGTRLGIIGMVLGSFLGLCLNIFLKSEKISIFRKTILSITGVLILFVLLIGIWHLLPQNFAIVKSMNFILSGKLDSSNLGRLTAWAAAWDCFSTNKIWGNGPGTFLEIHTKYLNSLPQIPELKRIAYLPVAHNEILNILAESGIIGLFHVAVVVVICLISTVRYLRKFPKESFVYGLLGGFIVMFSLMMFDSSPSRGFDPWLMGTMFSLSFKQKEVML